MSQIQVSNIMIDVVRKNIKNLHLGVYPPNGRVRIAAPLRIDNEAVRLFAVSKIAWIKKHRARFDGQERQAEREYISGESHYYNGQRYLLKVSYQDVPPRVELTGKTHIALSVRPQSGKERREEVMLEWYRTQLKSVLPDIIKKWEKMLKVEVREWRIKHMKTKWGTCNTKAKRIWLNLELAKKPPHCLEYIVVHEMVHLLEKHHNNRFVAYMDMYVPKWRLYKEELNRFILSPTKWEY